MEWDGGMVRLIGLDWGGGGNGWVKVVVVVVEYMGDMDACLPTFRLECCVCPVVVR